MGDWDSSERRPSRHLTPLPSELFPRDLDRELDRARRSPREKLARLLGRRRVQRRMRRHWIVGGLVRLGIAVVAASGLALLINAVLDRQPSVGFYLSGGLVLAAGFLTASAPARIAYVDVTAFERQRRLRYAMVYILVGVIVIGIGVLLETLGR